MELLYIKHCECCCVTVTLGIEFYLVFACSLVYCYADEKSAICVCVEEDITE